MEVTDSAHPQGLIAAELGELERGGFSFDNVVRNDLIMNKLSDTKMTSVLPKAWKTGILPTRYYFALTTNCLFAHLFTHLFPCSLLYTFPYFLPRRYNHCWRCVQGWGSVRC